ncbi:MAG: hypothetical protein WAN78_06690 [Methanoregula sp.]
MVCNYLQRASPPRLRATRGASEYLGTSLICLGGAQSGAAELLIHGVGVWASAPFIIISRWKLID